MAQAMLLPLRSTQSTSTWATLETRVRQIESQKGSFRTVTEQGLHDEIEKAKSGNLDVVSESEESEEEDESPETKQKKLWEAREEMLKQLLRAQNETLTALDSISLLLSGHAKAGAGAKLSMSPALSSAVPDSTIDAQKVHVTQSSLSQDSRNQSIHLGYKVEGLNNAIEKIETAKSRLNDQAQQESAFWKQVSDLSAQGIVISRLPRDSRIIGVHFGFPEAAPKFRNRGFAVLRADQEGHLRLDQAIANSKQYAVRVSILENGKLISASKPLDITSSETSLASNVADIRRSLFEEELFFEIGREARIIANQNVSTVGNMIVARIDGNQTVHIELIQRDEPSMEDDPMASGIADGVLICLRGLLSKGHEQTLARRSQPPPPLVPKALPLPEYALLRPLLSHMRHRMVVSRLQTYCDSLRLTMDAAGLGFDTKYSTASANPASGLPSYHRLLLETMLAPADSATEITLPTGRKLEIKTTTHLAPPAFGTVFTTSLTDTLRTPPLLKMSNLEAVRSTICSVLRTDIVEIILEANSSETKFRWTSKASRSGLLRSHNAILYVSVNIDTSLAVRYRKELKGTPPTEELAWMWHAGMMSEAPAGTHELHETQGLIDVVGKLLRKDD
jgi:mediator of RNA polymerase II transcription subunit 17